MQIPIVAALAAVAITATSVHAQSPARSDPVLVQAVIDGDTIVVSALGRVRLLGIDAPKLGRGVDSSAPFAREARDRLASLVLHRWVRLEHDGPARGASNRRLAYVVTEDGQFINARLVSEGLARVSARLPLARLPELKHAEADARASRCGIWGSGPQIPSTSYTRPAGARSKAPRAKTSRSKARAGRATRATRATTKKKKKPT